VHDETRLPTFRENFLHVEAYHKKTGVALKMNEYADLTPDEYQIAIGEDKEKKVRADIEREEVQEQADTIRELDQDLEAYVASLRESNSPKDENTAFYETSTIPRDETKSKAAIIHAAYSDWCKYYEKEFDRQRLKAFTHNYLQVERYHEQTGISLQLNEYSDLLTEEYNALMAQMAQEAVDRARQEQATSEQHTRVVAEAECKEQRPMSSVQSDNTKSEEERARDIYTQWCEYYEKPFDESRFPVFATNLKQLTNYHDNTGQALEMNEYSDLSEEEYLQLRQEEELANQEHELKIQEETIKKLEEEQQQLLAEKIAREQAEALLHEKELATANEESSTDEKKSKAEVYALHRQAAEAIIAARRNGQEAFKKRAQKIQKGLNFGNWLERGH